MKNTTIASVFIFLCLTIHAYAQNFDSWAMKREPVRAFIENKGQFKQRGLKQMPQTVEFGYDGSNQDYFFTKTGVIVELTTREKRIKSEEEKKWRAEKKKQGFSSAEDFKAFENIGHRLQIDEDDLFIKFLDGNPEVEIVSEEKEYSYHSYTFYNENNELINVNHIPAWKKITYKNIYPNIDIEYIIHPIAGFKYSVIVRPGGDISKVQLQYSKNIQLNADGTISTPTRFGNIIDHAPLTFYANNKNQIIQSSYKVENNIISFDVAKYDKTKVLVIDPWTQTPNFVSTGWDCIWECERDGAGNVYVIGGTSPMQLIKYSPAGAIQWTYNTPYDTTAWLGTFAVDNAGNSYVSNGSSAAIFKVNTAAALQWNNTNPGGLLALTEFWTITFNCDQTKLLIGGTDGGIFGPPEPYLFDINMNSGNVLTSKKMHGSSLVDAQEVRAITPCNNGKYYYLSHDTIGWIHQSLTACGAQPIRVNNSINLSYKCEDWRYNNTGIAALAHYNGFVFVHRGNQLQKRTFATGAIVATATIPGGAFTSGFGGNTVGCSGIDIDNCGNIFVGSINGVYKFDQALNQTGSFATTFNVYDVEVNSNGEVIAGGSTGNSTSGARTGYIQSFAAAACTPQAIVCCDATVCPVGPLCTSAAPAPMVVVTSGGTFSATCGACINATTGVFNPAIAGVGTHTITYTLPCGSETITVVVNNCSALTVCQELNGTLTVTGGTGPYTWSQWNPGGTTPITNQTQCLACNASYTWIGFPLNQCLNGGFPVSSCNVPAGYVTFGTGANITLPTPVTYPVRVVDNAGTVFTINAAGTVPPCVNCPTFTITVSNQINPSCFGQSTGSFSVTTSGGSSPYDYFLMNGATLVANFNNVAGAQLFTGLAAGTYTLNILDNNSCQGTTTIIITQPTALNISLNTSNNASCAVNNGSIDMNVFGGTVNYTYNWSNGRTTQDITGLAAGNYVLTVTDANGCTAVSNTINITQASSPTVTLTNATNATCGLNNGSIDMTISGGTAAYTYNWSNSRTTQDITGLGAGTYTLTVTDANNCTATNGPINITQTPGVTATLSNATNATCGLNNGSIDITISGGTAAYTYNWSNGRTTQDITGLGAGTYTLTVTDANNCTVANGPINITQTPGVTATLSNAINATCGLNNGSIDITISGGTAAYTYNWSNGRTTQDITGLGAGTYTLTVTDANNCTATNGPINITQSSAITITLDNTTNASCIANDGTISISVAGGNAGYTYNWSNGRTTQDITGLGAGGYIVTVTDANSCTMVSNSIIVGSASGLNISIDSIQNINCNGANNGFIDITVSSGTPTYTYLWSNGATTADLTGLAAGSVGLTVTDMAGCSITSGTINITEPNALTISLNNSNNATCGLNNGNIDVNITGGTIAYTYLWSNTATTQDLTGLSGGNYSLTVTDANNCTTTSSINITQSSAVSISLDNTTNANCGLNTGSIDIGISGGVAGYTYLWSNTITTQDITGLTAGVYDVTATDANGCTAVSSMTVTGSSAITTTVDNIQNVSCNGGNDGFINTTTTGGTPIYTYLWSNGATTDDVSGLLGTISCTITDANGCTSTNSFTITEPSAISITVDSTNTADCGLNDGSISISVAGGVGAYTYSWSNTATTQDITGLNAGGFVVTITDATGCLMVSNTIVVNSTSGLSMAIDTTQAVSCNGGSNGYINILTSGGTTPYTYLWSNTATTNSISGLAAGAYEVTITDGIGCSITSGIINILEPSLLVINVDTVFNINCGASDGGVNITVSGGTPNYTYLWSNTSINQNLAGIAVSGNYTVTVTDANGCTSNNNAAIGNNSSISLSAAVTNISCNGGNNGAINIGASGGSGNYTYLWSNSATTQNATGLIAGVYTATVTDNFGCVGILTETVTEPSVLTLTANTNTVSCVGIADGQLTAVAAGGTPNYTYTWSNTANGATITALSIGIYSVTATDANNCTTSFTTSITDATPIVLNINPIADSIGCDQNPIGALEAIASGGAGNFIYSWSNSANTAMITGLAGGVYTLTVTDNNGCTTTTSATVYQAFVPSISAFVNIVGQQNVLVGQGDTVFVNSGSNQTANGVTYVWTATPNTFGFSNSTAPSTNALPSDDGVYNITITATSLDGCVASDTLLVTVQGGFIGMPNAFVPDGYNDHFRPVGLTSTSVLEFKIFNRWGQLIYDNADIDNTQGWNGKYMGVDQPSEAYIYLLRYKLIGQEEKVLRGDFMLIR